MDLHICEFPDNELALIAKWRSNPEVNQYIRKGIQSLEEVQEWKRDYFSGDSNQLLSIRFRDNPVGYFTVEGIDHVNRKCEFGIVIGETNIHRKGVGSGAVKLMLGRAFGDMNMHRVFAAINEGNVASIKCFEHAGFAYEGKHRQAKLVGNGFRDILFYSVLANEWSR